VFSCVLFGCVCVCACLCVCVHVCVCVCVCVQAELCAHPILAEGRGPYLRLYQIFPSGRTHTHTRTRLTHMSRILREHTQTTPQMAVGLTLLGQKCFCERENESVSERVSGVSLCERVCALEWMEGQVCVCVCVCVCV